MFSIHAKASLTAKLQTCPALKKLADAGCDPKQLTVCMSRYLAGKECAEEMRASLHKGYECVRRSEVLEEKILAFLRREIQSIGNTINELQGGRRKSEVREWQRTAEVKLTMALANTWTANIGKAAKMLLLPRTAAICRSRKRTKVTELKAVLSSLQKSNREQERLLKGGEARAWVFRAVDHVKQTTGKQHYREVCDLIDAACDLAELPYKLEEENLKKLCLRMPKDHHSVYASILKGQIEIPDEE